MNTLWTAAPVARVHADGVARARPADDDPLFRSDDDVSTTTSASASASAPAPTGGEDDDTVGELRVRVGRIDAWREQGFASAREQREHHRSDLFRYNQRRKRAGRAPVTESEFQAMLEGGDEVSSISGSDDSDSESDDDDDDDDSNAATKHLRALHGKAEGAQVVCVGDDGVPYGVWRCLLRPDATKAADADATANVTPEEALRALRSDPSRPWVVLLARGGHFAGAVFDPRKLGGGSGADERQQKGGEGVRGGPLALVPPACAVAHKTFHRYVVRAKAGGRQSVKDQGGKTIKSAGSSIRRANEAALQREVLEALETWRERLNDAALVFVAASATDQRTLFEGKNPPLSRRDPRVRRIPFATQRPTFNEARRVMARLATVNYKMVEKDDANDDDTSTRGGSVRSSDVTREGTKHRHRREDEDEDGDGAASAGALTPAQAARLAAMNARAAEAAAEAAAAMRLDETLDEHLDEHRAEEIKILSKKEKEKLKKARAKERQKAEKAAERAADGADDETDAKTNANGVLEGTSSAPSKATKAAKTATAKGGKAAALLAKAKQAEAAKRDEKVREYATTRPSRHFGFRFFFFASFSRGATRLDLIRMLLSVRLGDVSSPRARVSGRRPIMNTRRFRVPPTNRIPSDDDSRRV